MADNPENLEFEYRKQRYETYLKEREALRHDSLEVSRRYDQAIIALAGGSLVLSVTFLEKIAPHPSGWTFWLLGVAWIFLILSVLWELFALSTTQTTTNEVMEYLSEDYRSYLQSLSDTPPLEQSNSKASIKTIEKLKERTRRLNIWSIRFLAAGVALLCLFSICNLPKSVDNQVIMSNDQKKPSPKRLVNESKGSYIPPSIPLPPPPAPKPPTGSNPPPAPPKK